MNTAQNYTGKNGSAKRNYQAVNSGLTSPTVEGGGATQNVVVSPNPYFIHIPVGIAISGRTADSYGASAVDVLTQALDAYKEEVMAWHSEEKETVLDLINDLKESTLDAIYNRLSDVAGTMHSQKGSYTDPSERSSKSK